jgi:hypothetical protein
MISVKAKIEQWNAEKLLGRAAKILDDYGPKISFQLQEEIVKKQFDWPVATRRKSGQLVPPGLRDILDTGELLNSQTNPVVVRDGSLSVLTIQWLAPYSGEVLRGWYLVGTVRNNYIAEGRDWISPALKNQPFRPFFIRRWQALAGK